MSDHLVMWDFDGTLAFREGAWGSALMRALDELAPGHSVARDDIRHYARDGFPWHYPERPHPHLNEPEAWWGEIEELMARAFEAVGYVDRAAELAAAARDAFIDPATHIVYEDTVPALVKLTEHGWRHVILSNHVPELEQIVGGLGLAAHFEAVHTSALLGYDKPHAEAFRLALRQAGDPSQVWMVGDNPLADLGGALALGIPAILVRREFRYPRYSPDLKGAVDLILQSDACGGSQP